MNPIVKNILAVVAGLIAGSLVNMAIIMLSSHLVLPPQGIDTSTMEGLKEALPLFEPKHFLMPFLAHAIGTLVGAYITVLLAASHKMTYALVIGCFFLLGGITNVILLPSPTWFTVLDLAVAYLPMAWLGGRLGFRPSN